MITELPERECRELLATTTVGRIGFVADDRVHIFPVNYAVSGDAIVLRTSSDGVLHRLSDEEPAVAFEIDYHDDLGGGGWSVLIQGRLSPTDERSAASARHVSAWAGGERESMLSVRIETIAGRRVRRERP
ncbi:nitroimidazol reductase NimA-like FMN-containing flavoprotein (pyridoxamine 5'-phosphate oxidase superfamily) [Microbacterium ginsengiterrae]|uniref:Nitroimidazol reductase NimA-like FMN-containing flavoprotein (Pyridoxamine 5'-phosphate oxidase superfamily) n=1 Tax=Microbacterium ginsengiterrae TaxID=546115 RepID=A0A7W9CDG9_9MICO|nr:pyridoxamine 5'-phosphate oxidase family protein [Microbacterium ginsengiterrae]MBB5743481.1 nitroimidazol reductase NimA-like FMN-containing flavoprotein (pyridoxamine 5'-phosphate oxidase superfamily) [Microbacterium ginsengiterrae]